MGLSISSLTGLKSFSPSSLKDGTLEFFEFLKFHTKDFRELGVIEKEELIDEFLKQHPQTKSKSKIKNQFDDFCKKLDSVLFIKNGPDQITEINWKKIDEFCNLLRHIEKSNERKIRWTLFQAYSSGKQKISMSEINQSLSEFKIANIPKILKKITKDESTSGLDSTFDGKNFIINHFVGDKLVGHYLADAVEEPSRRSPGELEEQILELIDEGSYSNLEISKALSVDETLVSRAMSRLRNKNKVVLSSFGQRGMRYYTTNCDNCPFGTTKSSCRKDALSFIITAFSEDFGIELSANDFDEVESNQAILKMKRLIMNARKEKNTKLEKNLAENLSKFLGRVVDQSLELKLPSQKSPNIPQIKVKLSSDTANLPLLYQLGLSKGAKSGIQLVDKILKHAMSSVKKEERLRIKKHANQEINKFLKNIGITNPID